MSAERDQLAVANHPGSIAGSFQDAGQLLHAHSHTCYHWLMDHTKNNITNIDEARRRRRYIALANASPAWLETVASFCLSGIEVTDRQAVLAGRMIAGEITIKEICDEIHAEHIRSAC